jgi:outer membrane receptor protein involved in Fe transport
MDGVAARRTGKVLGGLLLGTTILAGVPALAQDAATAEAEDDVIVVTSQRREQDLQDVPLSVQVLGTEQMDNLQVSDFEDYVKFLPSVSTTNFGGPFSQLVYMRGVASGGDGNHSGPMPSVGTYLDEQPITTAQGNLNVHLYDIARVESLAGPQGTLYGASSQAGTIRIITNKPDTSGFDMSLAGELNTVAHGAEGGSLEGMVNLPLNDMAALRVVGWYVQDAGYIDNVRAPRTYPTSGETDDNGFLAEDNFNNVETYGARAALGIDLDDNWTVTPAVMAQHQRANGSFAWNPRLGDLNTAVYRDSYGVDEWYQASLAVEGKIGNFDLVYSGAYLDRAIDGLADYSDYSYFYDTEAGYGTYFVGDCPANDYSCDPINPSQYIRSRDRFTKLSQELRLSTDIGDRLRFTGGAFFQRQTHNIEQAYTIDNLAQFLGVTGWDDTIWLTKQERVDRDFAVFGQAEFDLTDDLTLTGGARYFRYNNTLVGFFGYSTGNAFSSGEKQCFAGPVVEGSPCTNLGSLVGGVINPARSKDDGYIHRLNLTWNATPDNMFYATWSRGFRPGGSNRRGGFAYGADFLTNYELGMKHTLLDGAMRWNTAVFQQDWNNFQFAILGPNGLTEIRNAAQARIRGIESDVTIEATDGLTIGFGGTYLDAKLAANYCGTTDAQGVPITNCAAPLAARGTQLPASPEFKGNLVARYEFPVSGDLLAHVQVAGVYQTSIRTELQDADDALIGRQDGYGTVDFSLGVENEEAGWNVELYATNLFDERGTNYQYTQCFISVCANPTNGVVYQVPNQPATFGLKIGWDY